jgi:transposase
VTVILDAAGRYFASFVVETDPEPLPQAGTEVGRRSADAVFTSMLEYKARKHGRAFGRTGRWEPTSQVCSACGARDGPKPLSVRTWTCVACGAVHDRDVNAARNILALGRRERLNACGGQVRPGEIPAPASETGTLRGTV